jgi:hypothetical protein
MSNRPMISVAGSSSALAAFAGLAFAVLALASVSPAAAAPAKAVAASPASPGVTDFSAARRHRYYRRGPSAAGLAFMGAATGLIAGAIVESRRQEYYDNYYYGRGPAYGPGYGYYGGGPYYGGPRYYYQPY